MGRWSIALVVVVLVSSLGCGGNSATSPSPTPTPPSVPACQSNNTALISFENKSNSNTVYSVVWDGSNTMTLTAGQKSDSRAVAAGIPHTLTFKITNTNVIACSTSTPTLAQCSSMNYWCTY